ncbi:MAG TPA: ABC transporter permease [Burkholderiales bacterium]|nr:ABC transporter permease [Burkholderiales bacterium]
MKRLAWFSTSVLFLAALLVAWKLAADAKLVNPLWFPGPDKSFSKLFEWVTTGSLWAPLGQTVWRMFAGWLLACAAGITLGAAIASSTLARRLLQPSAEFLRPLPASAILPPAILVLGFSDAMIVFVVAFGCVWPILLGAIHGFGSLDQRLTEVSRLLNLSAWDRAWKFQLPNALPHIFAGMRVSIAIALIVTVASEMLSSQPGVGYLMLVAARAFRSADIFAGIIVLGMLGFLTNYATQKLEDWLLRWRPA